MESSGNSSEDEEKNSSKLYSLLPKDLIDEIDERIDIQETNKEYKDIQSSSELEKNFEYPKNKIKDKINSTKEMEDSESKNLTIFEDQNITNKTENNYITDENTKIKNNIKEEKNNIIFSQNPSSDKIIGNAFSVYNDNISRQFSENKFIEYEKNAFNNDIKNSFINNYYPNINVFTVSKENQNNFSNNNLYGNVLFRESINKSGKKEDANNNKINIVTDVNPIHLNFLNNIDQNNLQPFKYNINDVNNFLDFQGQRNITESNNMNLYPREYNYSRIPTLNNYSSIDFNQMNFDFSSSKNEQINPNLNNNDASQIIILINKIGINLFIQFVKTYKGSVYLQNILSNKKLSRNESNYIVNLIGMSFNDIICDYYGNYFFQKFIFLCSNEDRINIYHYIKNNFIKLATDICGSHSLQCLISLLSTEEEKKIIKDYIISDLKFLCFNQNGANIIAKIISIIKEPERNYINKIIINNFTELSTNINGVITVRALIKEIENHVFIKEIIFSAENNLTVIVTNQFGYLVIRDIIEKLGYTKCRKIINLLIEKIVYFSILKYSSNIIIFILNYLLENNFIIFIRILKTIFINENNFKEMIKNKFSTFVIEKAFELINQIDFSFFKGKTNLNNNNEANKLSNNDEQPALSLKNKEINDDTQEEYEEDNLDYQQYLNLKKQIYIIFEQSATNKEKQKIFGLLKNKGINNNNDFH